MTPLEAVSILKSTYQPLDMVVRGLIVNAKEIAEALEKADENTIEFVCLNALAKANPYIPEPNIETEPVIQIEKPKRKRK